jgi:hypothetical protein
MLHEDILISWVGFAENAGSSKGPPSRESLVYESEPRMRPSSHQPTALARHCGRSAASIMHTILLTFHVAHPSSRYPLNGEIRQKTRLVMYLNQKTFNDGIDSIHMTTNSAVEISFD